MHQHLLDLGLQERLSVRDASMASGQSALAPIQQNKTTYRANTSNINILSILIVLLIFYEWVPWPQTAATFLGESLVHEPVLALTFPSVDA